MEVNKNICKWKLEEEEDTGIYETSCGDEIYFEDSDFKDCYKFCPFCGKKIEEVKNGNE